MLSRRSACKAVHHPYGFPVALSLQASSLVYWRLSLRDAYECCPRLQRIDNPLAMLIAPRTMSTFHAPSRVYDFLYLEGSTLRYIS